MPNAFADCPLPGIPHLEATAGRWTVTPWGGLRFTRTFRCQLTGLQTDFDGATPRDLDRRLAAYCRDHFAQARSS